MLDVSRDRVPTRQTLEFIVERLARCRYNHFQLYTEHTFAYRGHDDVWRHASPMTADDMSWLDALCAASGIELAANQNTFGHMERWLRHPRYRSMAETPDGFSRFGRVSPPSALAPTSENASFALELVEELMSTVASPRVNIGCDEVFELGDGASAGRVAAVGRTATFVEHVERIALPLLASGNEVQFWADMLERDPAAGSRLAAEGAVATLWSYAAPGSVDRSTLDLGAMTPGAREIAEGFLDAAADGFGPRLERFASSGFRTWVAPGTSGWNSFVGRHANARANVADAVEAAIGHDAEGVLITEWGDNGHQQPPFATLPALAYGGAAMWCAASNIGIDDDDVAFAVSDLVDDDSGRFGAALIQLGTAVDRLGVAQLNEAQFFRNWVRGGHLVPVARPSVSDLDATLAHLDAATATLHEATVHALDGDQLVAESLHAAAMARHGVLQLRSTGEGGTHDSSILASAYEDLRRDQERHWLARARPGGLVDSLARLRPPAPPDAL